MLERPITKRLLGYLFILGGIVGIVGPFLIDLLQAGQYQGIGSTQRLVLLASLLLLGVGLSLLPFGDRPA